ncbi:Neuroblastoma breakpoint family member 6 [Vulpes lagopus]
MAAPLGPQSDPRAEISLLEINQELQSKLEKSQQDFRDLKEKFLMSEATAYSLANQLQKYRESYKVMVSNVVTGCKELTDIIESVLGEKLQLEEGKRTEVLAEKLRQCHILIKDHAKELTRLYQKLREGTDISERLNEHLEDLLTHDDPEHSRGQRFQEQLTEGGRLAKRLARKLSSGTHKPTVCLVLMWDTVDRTFLNLFAENYDDEEDEEKQETLTPSLEQQEVEKKGILQDPQDECVLTPSILQDGSESHQASGDGEFPSDEQEFDSAVDLPCECSSPKGLKLHVVSQKIKKILGKEMDTTQCPPGLEQQEVEKKEVLQDPPDECVLTPSILQDGSESHQASGDGEFQSDEQEFDSAVDLPCECSQSKGAETPRGPPESQLDHEELKGQESVAPRKIQPIMRRKERPRPDMPQVSPHPTRLSRELPEVKEQDVPRDPLDECYLTYSALPDLTPTRLP